MRKITTMPMLNANPSTESMKMRGAQCAGIILALACFLMLASSAGAQFTPLYNFGTHVGDPAHPNYPGFVVQGRDGNLYSTSYDGGTDNAGTVFKVTPAGQVTVLYSFDGVMGAFPSGGLTLSSDGNFYGSTFENGPSNYGTVFKFTAERETHSPARVRQHRRLGPMGSAGPGDGWRFLRNYRTRGIGGMRHCLPRYFRRNVQDSL